MGDAFSLSPLIKSSSCHYLSGNEDFKSSFYFDNEDLFQISNLHSPPIISEMVFEKVEEFSCKEEEIVSSHELHLKSFIEECMFYGDANLTKPEELEGRAERNDAMVVEGEGDGENEYPKTETEEEVGSISTRESIFAGFTNIDNDCLSLKFEDYRAANPELYLRLKAKALEMTRNRSEQEKDYIEKTLSFLFCSFQEPDLKFSSILTDDILESILIQLLEDRKANLGAEVDSMKKMIEDEISEIKKERPDQPIEQEDLTFNRRKIKKMLKGRKNNSNLNHVNENYVSNIFQFAKRNFPEDRELQRLANERNVSAINFRKLMNIRLTDSYLTRRAKARIIESGRELVSNVEYWMNEGYFDQCKEREKYIAQKQKALIDLALFEEY